MNPERDLKAVERALMDGAFESALAQAQTIVRTSPDHVLATRLMGAALRGCGRHAEANAVLSALAERVPDDALIQNSLGAVRRSLGDLDGAGTAFARACRLAPELAPVWFNHAIVLFMQDDVPAGLKALDRVVALAPQMTQARMLRADMLREQGRTQQVTAEYRAALRVDPLSPWPWFGLSNLKNVPMSEADIEAIRVSLRSHPQKGDARTALQFALAKALEDNAHFAEAIRTLDEANAEVRQRIAWDSVRSSFRLDTVLDAFSPAPLGSDVEQGREVVFIVSLPRSGSTLVEQILASHPHVEGAGERDYANRVIEEEERRRGAPITQWAKTATAAEWRRLGERYLQITASNRQRKPRFTDKALGNWRIVGALLAMLPQARVVVCRRDPLETCFSCYRQWFAQDPHLYSYDIDDLAEYWREFDRACKLWKALHPDRVHELVHEDLIADQDLHTRRLLDFCDLPFDAACIDFHLTQRKITTISSSQVREPLRRDTAHAPNYGALLDPFRVALDIPPLAKQPARRRTA